MLDSLIRQGDSIPMRRLMLLRHAKTERAEPGQRDRDRKLMKRGRADAPKLGAYMAHHDLIPDLALVSPAVRAEETWDLVADAFDKPPRTEADDRIYNASPHKLLQIVAEPRSLNLKGYAEPVMDLPIYAWSQLRPHSARLERFVTPRLIAAATE